MPPPPPTSKVNFHSNCALIFFPLFRPIIVVILRDVLIFSGIFQPYYRVFFRLFGPIISVILWYFPNDSSDWFFKGFDFQILHLYVILYDISQRNFNRKSMYFSQRELIWYFHLKPVYKQGDVGLFYMFYLFKFCSTSQTFSSKSLTFC